MTYSPGSSIDHTGLMSPWPPFGPLCTSRFSTPEVEDTRRRPDKTKETKSGFTTGFTKNLNLSNGNNLYISTVCFIGLKTRRFFEPSRPVGPGRTGVPLFSSGPTTKCTPYLRGSTVSGR